LHQRGLSHFCIGQNGSRLSLFAGNRAADDLSQVFPLETDEEYGRI